jgi:hypothetical protein
MFVTRGVGNALGAYRWAATRPVGSMRTCGAVWLNSTCLSGTWNPASRGLACTRTPMSKNVAGTRSAHRSASRTTSATVAGGS